jgi:hypothetical protein
VLGLVWFQSGLADFVATGRLGVEVKEVQSPMAVP